MRDLEEEDALHAASDREELCTRPQCEHGRRDLEEVMVESREGKQRATEASERYRKERGVLVAICECPLERS